MGFKSRATSRSRKLPPLDIKCNHLGTTEYWCRGCAWIAATMLRQEHEERDRVLDRIAEKLERAAFNAPPLDSSAMKSIREDVLNAKRWK